ncbi:MAG: glucan biosynthesis protein, partial [Planctomycetota bacterium]
MHPLLSGSLLLAAAAPSAIRRVDEALPPGVSDAAAHRHRHAQDLAQAPPRELAITLPEAYAKLDYDSYRAIRARRDKRIALGEGSYFSAEVLHLGAHYRVPVSVGVWAEGDGIPGYDEVAYDGSFFDLPAGLAPLMGESGFAGVRFFYEDPAGDEPAEFLVFHGASYFRSVGRQHGFGTSARCVALGTAEPGGEEFPSITSVLVEPPAAGDRSLWIHALLESKSLTGVMSMVATPGVEAAMDVEVTLYPRVDLKTVGIAPLTSMFYFDRGLDRGPVDDVRRAVHDAHGLKVITGTGERLWRPLVNPPALEVSAFLDDSPRGFGLVQRSRAFDAYGDAEARYERRPSVWIEPLPGPNGLGWGPGAVHLVEIPTDSEFNDNMVAFWRPAEPLVADVPHRFSYRMAWCDEPADRSPLWRVKASRTGVAPNDGRRLFVVDFEPGSDDAPDLGGARVVATSSAGMVGGARLQRLPGQSGWRATIDFDPGEEVTVAELTLRLERG